MFLRTLTLIVLAGFFLSGPAGAQSRPHVNSTVDITHSLTAGAEGRSVTVVAYVDAVNADDNFNRYKTAIETNLSGYGFKITADATDTDLIAFIAYGLDPEALDEGKTAPAAATVLGKSGRLKQFASSGYRLPDHVVLPRAEAPKESREKVRRLTMELVERRSLESSSPKTVYAANIDSRGICGVVDEVMDEMLLALFKEFPGESGSSKFHVIYEASYSC